MFIIVEKALKNEIQCSQGIPKFFETYEYLPVKYQEYLQYKRSMMDVKGLGRPLTDELKAAEHRFANSGTCRRCGRFCIKLYDGGFGQKCKDL